VVQPKDYESVAAAGNDSVRRHHDTVINGGELRNRGFERR